MHVAIGNLLRKMPRGETISLRHPAQIPIRPSHTSHNSAESCRANSLSQGALRNLGNGGAAAPRDVLYRAPGLTGSKQVGDTGIARNIFWTTLVTQAMESPGFVCLPGALTD
jgi:hypothetical protein